MVLTFLFLSSFMMAIFVYFELFFGRGVVFCLRVSGFCIVVFPWTTMIM